MIRPAAAALAASAVLAAALAASAQVPASAPPQGPSPPPSPAATAPAAQAGGVRPLDQAPRRVPGYLGSEGGAEAYLVLPVPPTPGSKDAHERVDREAFEVTRKLQGGPRWTLAASDAVESPAAVLADFDCIFGLDLTPQNAPALLRMLTRVRSDAGVQTTRAKNRFQHWRPFVSYGGPICTPDVDAIAHSWSYPSGHTTMGWSYGLILAELAPDLATPILQRARSYGESRVVCGVHTVSDIEQGQINASMMVAALHANAEFKADLEAARLELVALRARNGATGGGSAPAGRACAVEKAAMERTPWLAEKDLTRAGASPPRELPKHVGRPLRR